MATEVAAAAQPTHGEANGTSAAALSAPSPTAIDEIVRRNAKRTRSMFAEPDVSSSQYEVAAKARLASKIKDEYKDAKELPAALLAQQGGVGPARPGQKRKSRADEKDRTAMGDYIEDLDGRQGPSHR